MSFDLPPPDQSPEPEPEQPQPTMAERMAETFALLQDNMSAAQHRMERSANRKRKPSPRYIPGDRVWLSTRNIRTTRPSKKLDHKQLGPFRIIEKVGPSSYRLDLPPAMHIKNVFHSNLLRLDPQNGLPGQHQPPPPPVKVLGEDEWEVEEILNSRLLRGRTLQYKVRWVGFPHDDEWYNASLFNHAPEVTQAFHRRYPNKARKPDGRV